MVLYEYQCKECEENTYVDWKSTSRGTRPYCGNCGVDTTELTGKTFESESKEE